jgi:hypothetical protein
VLPVLSILGKVLHCGPRKSRSGQPASQKGAHSTAPAVVSGRARMLMACCILCRDAFGEMAGLSCAHVWLAEVTERVTGGLIALSCAAGRGGAPKNGGPGGAGSGAPATRKQSTPRGMRLLGTRFRCEPGSPWLDSLGDRCSLRAGSPCPELREYPWPARRR